MISSIYIFWFFLILFPAFLLVIIGLYNRLESHRSLKLSLGLILISSYGLIMSILATTALFIISISADFPPKIVISNLDNICSQSSHFCFRISNYFFIDLTTIYIILFALGIILFSFFFLQLISLYVNNKKIDMLINPVLSSYLTNNFSRTTGLPLNNITIKVINSSILEAYSFSNMSINKLFSISHTIVITHSLVKKLTDTEVVAVLSHEYGHIYSQDTLWLPILRLLSKFRLLYLNTIYKKLQRRSEIHADDLSAQWTRKPAHLASALLKIHDQQFQNHRIFQKEFFSINIFSSNNSLLKERIEHLLEIDIDSLPFRWPKW